MEKTQRKHTRLKKYEYSLPGYYYVTIHTNDPSVLLSGIERGPDPNEPVVELTQMGLLVQSQLLELEQRYRHVRIDKYVVMPTHIHAIIQIMDVPMEGDRPPALPDIVGVFKSLTTRQVNGVFQTPGRKIFQTPFMKQCCGMNGLTENAGAISMRTH